MINQNYDADWHGSVGGTAEVDGLLALDLPPGRHAVLLRHRPRHLGLGLAASLIGLALSAAVGASRRTKRGRAS